MLGLIMDTITGRSPLYKLEKSLAQQDMELLFGRDIPVEKLNDDVVGRRMDALCDAGTGLILTAVAVNAVRRYELERGCVHHDTTSLTVYGDYDVYKDADRGHPFVGARLLNGNESDKVINRHVLSEVAKKCRFITRLPRSSKGCREVVGQAVAQNQWEDLGVISPQRPTAKRKPAHYHGYEGEVALYGRRYRALVVHSDALDKKSAHKLESEVEQEKKELTRGIRRSKRRYAMRVYRTPRGR